MAHTVNVLEGAEAELREIYEYIREQDGVRPANRVLSKLETAFRRLSTFPERGIYTKELAALGVHEYREIRLKPYRIVYTIDEDHVFIVLIADGRRDMETLFERRLLGR